MKIETLSIDHPILRPPCVLYCITRDDGWKAYVWSDLGATFDADTLVFEENPGLPKSPYVSYPRPQYLNEKYVWL